MLTVLPACRTVPAAKLIPSGPVKARRCSSASVHGLNPLALRGRRDGNRFATRDAGPTCGWGLDDGIGQVSWKFAWVLLFEHRRLRARGLWSRGTGDSPHRGAGCDSGPPILSKSNSRLSRESITGLVLIFFQ